MSESNQGYKITIEIPEERVSDVLVGALEGGSNYWIARFERCSIPDGAERPVYAHEHVMRYGAIVTVDEGIKREYRLNADALRRGLVVMAEQYPRHFADLVSGRDDSITSDVMVQCALFGQIVFG